MLRDVTNVNHPFGARVILLGGDFRQVLPVVPRASRAGIVESCIKRSHLWAIIQQFQLTANMRARDNEHQFIQYLLDIGNGSSTFGPNNHGLPQDGVWLHTSVVPNVIDAVFPTLDAPVTDRAILTTKNESALEINKKVLAKLPGNAREYLSVDTIISDTAEEDYTNFPIEFLNSLTPSGMPRHRLILKSGALIMLLRNIDCSSGLCNGTRLIIRRLHNNVIEAEIIGSVHEGTRVMIPRLKISPSDSTLPVQMQREQFPVRLAYAMTINKAQGQTFDKVGIYLPDPVFTHGQLYVALSRAKSFNDIHVELRRSRDQGRHLQRQYFTRNIIYHEIL
jgi:ATP-dependent DNA helicase PIF1